ncbi:hypothetical protein [Leucobacter sp. GX24907]
MSDHAMDTPPPVVSRWENAGGAWQIGRITPDRAIVQLLRCDGGEIVDVAELTDPAEVRWAAAQESGAD